MTLHDEHIWSSCTADMAEPRSLSTRPQPKRVWLQAESLIRILQRFEHQLVLRLAGNNSGMVEISMRFLQVSADRQT